MAKRNWKEETDELIDEIVAVWKTKNLDNAVLRNVFRHEESGDFKIAYAWAHLAYYDLVVMPRIIILKRGALPSYYKKMDVAGVFDDIPLDNTIGYLGAKIT